MIIVKIGADWCGPCKMSDIYLKPQIEKAGIEYVSEDIGPNFIYQEKIEEKYNFKMSRKAIPTYLVIEDGKIKDIIVGYKPNLVQDLL